MSIAVYVRVSTQRQAQAQTIQQQLERLKDHIQVQGGELREEHIFRDDGYSGASLNRPGLDRLRDAVRAAEVDRVLVTDPDRLARNYVHQMVLLEELERFGCQVEFLERPLSQNPHDQLLLQIRSAVAEYERTLIAERMRRGRQMKLRAGNLLPWTHPPYGYRVDPERPRDPAGVQIEPAEAAVVQEIFAQYAETSVSLLALAQSLQGLGLPTPGSGRRWYSTTLRGMLRNPAYTGQVYAGRTRTRACCRRASALRPVGRSPCSHASTPPEQWLAVATIPALVTQEQFDHVQAKLSQNQPAARRNNKAHAYLLRTLVSCGHCRLACFGRALASGHDYYVCRGKMPSVYVAPPNKCPSRFIPAHQLDELIWQDLCEVLTHPDSITYALERARGGYWLPQQLQARHEQLRQGRVNLEHQLDRLTQAYLLGVIPLAEYQHRRQGLEQKSNALAAQAHQLERQGDRQAELAGQIASIKVFCQRLQTGLANATFEQKRALVELLIDRVVVTDGDVEIRYVIPTSPDSEQTRFCHLRKDYLKAQPLPVVRTVVRGNALAFQQGAVQTVKRRRDGKHGMISGIFITYRFAMIG